MKKKLLILVAALALLFMANTAFAELELGVGLTPLSTVGGGAVEAGSGDFLDTWIASTHIGFSWWWLFYASWDSLIIPPNLMQHLASVVVSGEEGSYSVPGPKVPGFINLFDLGIRPKIGPILAFAEIGINHMWVYGDSQEPNPYRYTKEGEADTNIGVNARVGAGIAFDWWGLTVSGTMIFKDFDDMMVKFAAATDETVSEDVRQEAINILLAGLIPSVGFNIYF